MFYILSIVINVNLEYKFQTKVFVTGGLSLGDVFIILYKNVKCTALYLTST